MKQYSSIEELTLTLALYPNQRKDIIEEAGMKFKLDGEYAFFVVAEDGNCALFNDRYELDDLSKIEILNEEMIQNSIKKINVPENVKSICDSAFNGCVYLEEINIPSSLEHIGSVAFRRCVHLKHIDIPQSVKHIESGAFSRCTKLESIVFPKNTRIIKASTFFECISLKDVVIEEGVEEIQRLAFFKCASIKKIIIPKNIYYIGNDAFLGCSSLEEVVFRGSDITLTDLTTWSWYPWGINFNKVKITIEP